jgi:hypothetical protein
MAPASYSTGYNWAGPYAGFQLGGGGFTANRQINGGGFANSYTGSGFIGGVFVGYNWVTPSGLVWGIEGAFNGANIAGNDAGVGGTTDATTINFDATLNGRLGVTGPQQRALFYITGGLAFASVSQTNSSGAIAGPSGLWGFNVGLGAELALTQRLAGRLAVNYKGYGAAGYTGGGVLPFSVQTGTTDVMVGLSMKLN